LCCLSIDCGAGAQSGTSVPLTTVAADTTRTVINARPGAPLPPFGTTDAADGISTTAAKLPGTVNPNGGTVSTCRFEYGTTTGYGQTVDCATTPTGSTSSPVAADVSGLAGGTTYHYRLVVITGAGTTAGGDRTFTTGATPATASTLPATGVGSRSATLNASVDPKGAAVSDCHYDYGTTLLYGSSVPCETPPAGNGAVPVPCSATRGMPG
jgi:hypothetical protein